MHDNWLIAIAMGTAALGMVGLLLVLLLLQPPDTDIATASELPDGSAVRITAKVIARRDAGTLHIATVSHEAVIDIVLPANLSLEPGDCIVASGKKGSFNGKPQLSASMIATCS
jgi:hypothetical protein